jgi:hypothetical protein
MSFFFKFQFTFTAGSELISAVEIMLELDHVTCALGRFWSHSASILYVDPLIVCIWVVSLQGVGETAHSHSHCFKIKSLGRAAEYEYSLHATGYYLTFRVPRVLVLSIHISRRQLENSSSQHLFKQYQDGSNKIPVQGKSALAVSYCYCCLS